MAAAASLLPADALYGQGLRFSGFHAFQEHLQAQASLWPAQVQQALRLDGRNFRDSFEHDGCVSRHRTVLLVLRQLIESGALPSAEQLRAFCPEAVTLFAHRLRPLIPRRRRGLQHQDVCALTLPAALAEIAGVLRPGGWLLATFPFAYYRQATIVKARHRPGASPGRADQAEQVGEPEFHGDPLHPQQGSLHYQIPGSDLLDQLRAAGLSDPAIHWIAAPDYGVLGQEIPAVLVLVAGR